MNKIFVNTTILNSIPLNGNLKRYFSARYRWLCNNNGSAFADQYFKETRQCLMTLISQKDHSDEAIREAVRNSPLRYNNMAIRLFKEGLTHPHIVLNFLKLYTGNLTVNPDSTQAYCDLKKELEEMEPAFLWPSIQDIPPFLRNWVNQWLDFQTWKSRGKETLPQLYQWYREDGDKMAKSHSFETWYKYWRTWSYQLTLDGLDLEAILLEVDDILDHSWVTPEMYKDSTIAGRPYRSARKLSESGAISRSHERDLLDWISMTRSGILMPNGTRQRIESFNFPSGLAFCSHPARAGSIDLVAKKGTNEFRPVAAPNRFLQETTRPAYVMLERVLRKFNMDATWNQDRFNTELVSWVTDDTIHPSGVDLHHATNGLPLALGDFVVQRILLPQVNASARARKKYRVSTNVFETWSRDRRGIHEKTFDDFPKLVKSSWDNFLTASQAAWRSPVGDLSFRRGQPLGMLPSFRTLSLTHHLLVEAMCYEMGYRDSPYRILGDDIVIKYQKVAKRYRSVMNDLRVEISEHKSYSGRLIEFAGKIFIKNQLPFHTPDHSTVTSTNVFDYGHVTGIPLRWNHLSRKTRKDIQRKVIDHAAQVRAQQEEYERTTGVWRHFVQPDPIFLDVPTDKATVARAFDLVSVVDSRNPYYVSKVDADAYGYLEAFTYFDDKDEESPLPYFGTGISWTPSGFLVSYEKNYRYYDRKNQRYQRHLAVKLPDWYKRKFRPVSTDILVTYGIVSLGKDTDSIQNAISRKATQNHWGR